MKKIIRNTIEFLKKTRIFFRDIKKSISNIYGNEKNEGDYLDLAPNCDAADCKEHIQALRWAFSNANIKNIALAGPYGSGKSSIIQTFLNCNPLFREKSIQISLATFSDKDKLLPLDIEEGIFKQLFYKVKQNEIPQSRYRKIRIVKYWSIFFKLFFGTLFAGVVTFVFFPSALEYIRKSVVIAGDKINMLPFVSMLLFCVLFVCTLFIIAKLLQQCASRFYIKDVKFPNEIATLSNGSKENEILNKRIDEIVYFFEKNNYRFVFFEDLDRFNNPEIFIKLREINTILNNYDAIDEKIVFVYAIKDDLFSNVERTKFFDFIIPVIPIINSTNSGETFLKLLNIEEGATSKYSISRKYIFDVSPFISEMRVLYNIYNEFLIYTQTIKVNQGLTNLDDEIMMTLIIFKNLYPDQFSLLQNEAGLVKEAFKLKTLFVNRIIKEMQQEIQGHIKILDGINNDVLKDQYELKYAMLCALTGWKGMAYSLTRSGYSTVYGSKVLESGYDISELLKTGQWNIRYTGIKGQNESVTINNVHEICASYADRLKYIQYANNSEQQRIKEQIVNLESDIRNISTMTLKELIVKFGSNKVFLNEKNGEEICKMEFLEFVLRKGYINEDYANYINFFKGNCITVTDMKFVISVKTQKPMSFLHKLSSTKCHQIIEKLQPYEFGERAILNFDLLEHMLTYHKNNDEKLELFIKQLSNESNDSWCFVNDFIDITKQEKRFVKMLSNAWPGFWRYIYYNSIITYERKLKYLSLLCSYLNHEELSEQNSGGLLVKFFVENESILQKVKLSSLEELKIIISDFNIRFCKLNISGIPNALLDYIFDNCYYEINQDMVSSIIEYKNSSLCSYSRSQNYTTILKLGYEPMLDYVHENWEKYVDAVILKDENVDETVESVLMLLDKSINNQEICNKMIKHIEFMIESFEEVCGNHTDDNEQQLQCVCDMLLENNRISVSWDGVYSYWRVWGMSTALCNYMERHADVLAKHNNSCLNDSFKESIILSEINNNAFEKLLSKIRMEKFTIALDQISKDRLTIMVHNRSFDFTVADYNEMVEYAPELCLKFILLNQEIFSEMFDQIVLSTTVFESLMLSRELSTSIKKNIVERNGVELMTPRIAKSLSDIDFLISKEVFASAWNTLDNVFVRKELLFKHLNTLELEDFEKYLVVLDEPYKKLERNSYRHEEFILDDKDNRALAERLKRVQYLTSIEYEKQFYRNSKSEVPVIRCRVKAKQAS